MLKIEVDQRTVELESARFILKSSVLYASFSAAFSVIGIFPIFEEFLPKPYVIGNPLEVSGISIEHVVGHVIFGLIVGTITLKMRYFALAGIFPIALDADHLIQFLNLEAIPRMGHSILFGLISIPPMLYFLGKKDYILGAISFTAVLTHISFDVLLGGTTSFPLLIPFQNKMITLQGYDWIISLILAVVIVGLITMLTKKTILPTSTNLAHRKQKHG
jgi:hypothetical protein